jgi:hypothetical protein
MGIGVGIFLFAVGAILKFAVHVGSDGIDLATVGVILMLVGGIGIALSMIFWSTWGGLGGSRRTMITESDPRYDSYEPGGRRIVREERVDRF